MQEHCKYKYLDTVQVEYLKIQETDWQVTNIALSAINMSFLFVGWNFKILCEKEDSWKRKKRKEASLLDDPPGGGGSTSQYVYST